MASVDCFPTEVAPDMWIAVVHVAVFYCVRMMEVMELSVSCLRGRNYSLHTVIETMNIYIYSTLRHTVQ